MSTPEHISRRSALEAIRDEEAGPPAPPPRATTAASTVDGAAVGSAAAPIPPVESHTHTHAVGHHNDHQLHMTAIGLGPVYTGGLKIAIAFFAHHRMIV